MKRFVKQSRRIGCHVRKFATEDFRFSLRVNYQPCQFRPGEHPLKCKLRKATLRLGITATDVRMYSGKPNLLDILLCRSFNKQIFTKKCSTLVDRDGVPDSPYVRVFAVNGRSIAL